MKITNKKTFQTDSFQLASFLLCESFPIISVDRTNSKRVVFVFEDCEVVAEPEREILTGVCD